MKQNQFAIIGSGPTAIYFLKHLLDNNHLIQNKIDAITIFEKRDVMGIGMPYTPETTDIYNLANISSEEIPELCQSFADWLNCQEKEQLKEWNINSFPISKSELYSRLALGQYFHHQYKLIISKLKKKGISIVELPRHQVTDIIINENKIEVKVDLKSFLFSKIVIAMGHHWSNKDKPERGYYASPWPIKKLLPQKEEYYNFEIGTLGASLSALDIVTSLAHRHGKFTNTTNGLTYHLNPEAKDFKIILHSAQGWLPHLQYAQELPIREIYRHTSRSEILSLVNTNGFLTLDTFFDKICRPALIMAFKSDKKHSIVNLLKDDNFKFQDFIDTLSRHHEYSNSFEGMQKEKIQALESIKNNKPIHWKETLDDLMYCLNFHMELICAEDYLFFTKKVMPFLMNVIAAIPLKSANIVLALYEAGCIDLVEGKVEVLENNHQDKNTKIKIEHSNGTTVTKNYRMFIDCSGQDSIEIENYPFQSMVKEGIVRKARAKFKKIPTAFSSDKNENSENIFSKGNDTYLYTAGIDIDASYRIITKKGEVQSTIYDATFAHIIGARPFSFGLQSCNATSSIIVESWLSQNKNNSQDESTIEKITQLYEQNDDV